MKLLLGAVLLAASATAHADPKVYDLPQVKYGVKIGSKFEYTGVQLVGSTPLLSARINAMLNDYWPATGSTSLRSQDGIEGTVTCDVPYATNLMISVGCEKLVSSNEMRGGVVHGTFGDIFLIKGDKVVHATIAELFGDAKDKIAALAGETDESPPSSCAVVLDGSANVYANGAGVQANGGDMPVGCTVGWKDVLPLLPKDSVLRAIQSSVAWDPRKAWKQDRFVVAGAGADETALDKATGLEWATHDNGADIAFADAKAYAKAAKVGGHTDWRLPTEPELEGLVEITGLDHREKADCTKGKSALMVSPVIHLSCGLAWAGSGSDQMGFISGTPRAVKPTVKVNSRALIVRGK